MGFFDNVLLQLDQAITGLLGQWNVYTTVIFTIFVGFVTFQVLTQREPDIHPMLLARQAQASPVRREGESPVYRSQAAPHGMPLNSGLNVKDAGASMWSMGRDGDIRDIWRRAVDGADGGPSKGATGRILTVMGDELAEHDLEKVTRQINLIGQHLLEQGADRVAIYLPNSVELLATLFACAFYKMAAVLLPFDRPEDSILEMLRASAADTVVTVPGSFPFDSVVSTYRSLRQLVWVVDEGSKHLDWNEVPEGTGGSVNVATWQDIISDAPVDAGRELPAVQGQEDAREIAVFWPTKTGLTDSIIRFTPGNLVSAVAAHIFAIPTTQRMGLSDLFLPADSLAHSYTLVLTLAALYSNSSIAFNSSAPQAPDLSAAMRGLAPTIVVATPSALVATHRQGRKITHSFLARQMHWLQTRSMVRDGVLPSTSFWTRYYDGLRPVIGTTAGRLRLVLTAERIGADTPRLSSEMLSDLRLLLRARIMYALLAPKVAGAVTQTGFYDYRVSGGDSSHFGAPLTCTEIVLKDKGAFKTTGSGSQGEVC